MNRLINTPLLKQDKPCHRTRAILFIAFVLSLFVSPTLLFTGYDTAEAMAYRYGHVVARGLFLGPNDKPIFAEIGSDGRVIVEIGEAIGELEDAIKPSIKTTSVPGPRCGCVPPTKVPPTLARWRYP